MKGRESKPLFSAQGHYLGGPNCLGEHDGQAFAALGGAVDGPADDDLSLPDLDLSGESRSGPVGDVHTRRPALGFAQPAFLCGGDLPV